ncbi:MAG: type I pullulanase [Rikenellaceae bacterium]|nr:type I pullulanase [Rikenellaceae bacterium]
MKKQLLTALTGAAVLLSVGCTKTKNFASYADYPTPAEHYLEMNYSPEKTDFALWAPTADEVRLSLYTEGLGGEAQEIYNLKEGKGGLWKCTVKGDKQGLFYTFAVRIGEKWMEECAGIDAKAVGVNGQRGAILDLDTTDPEGWAEDKRPALERLADAIIYEMHHRDFSIHATSGVKNGGKFLALTEEGTRNPKGELTGIDHLKELGITHVHILPSYDYGSVDETNLAAGKYNWGYDPVNYNVPDGGYSTNPFDPACRIREFKQMVQALHKAGIRVVLDVVYNHTFSIDGSNFERTVPGYFFRQREDGSYADASGCGNETASDREMMRRYMVESVKYWIEEYHLDGFRFDLMGIHDAETMRQIRAAADEIDPSILIYGEGWAAQAPQLPAEELAMKANMHTIEGVAAFSDELRDALRGPFHSNEQGAFLAGLENMEESIKFGIVGAIAHPQVDMQQVNYVKEPWAKEPTQMISYVSCHDDMCLVDRLKTTLPGIDKKRLVRLDKLAQTAVFTSQGIPFIFTGEEVMRDKKGVHNSYQSPDEINAIDWMLKSENRDLFDYYKGLVALRKAHPAFRLGKAELVREHLEFLPVEGSNLVAFRLKNNAGGDAWSEIVVVLNARQKTAEVELPEGNYTAVCYDGKIDLNGLKNFSGKRVKVSAESAVILHQ